MADYTLHDDLLVLENLSVKYNGRTIIRDIGTSQIPFVIKDVKRTNMQQGQVVAIVGRSGRGKSTLFKAITGIIAPSSGSIKIPDFTRQKEFRCVREGDVGFVQQNFPLSRNQTVLEMLNDAAKQGKIAEKERKDLINDYLETWGLKDQRNHASNQLSGGQRQRVAIIEQLLCSHYYIAFDEPFSGLDVCNIQDVINSFKKITTTNEINTILFSTHDLDIAVGVADVIYVIGYEKDTNGSFKDGGTVVGHYDLKELNLAWQEYCPGHKEIVEEITEQFKVS